MVISLVLAHNCRYLLLYSPDSFPDDRDYSKFISYLPKPFTMISSELFLITFLESRCSLTRVYADLKHYAFIFRVN